MLYTNTDIGRHRGRPRKYPPKTSELDFDYDKYFIIKNKKHRNKEKRKNININNSFIEEIFNFIYKENYCDKLFSKPEKYKDEIILYNLSINKEIDNSKPKNEKSIDDIIYEYLLTLKKKTNKKYFSFMIKFV